jgi:hypothetical protein
VATQITGRRDGDVPATLGGRVAPPTGPAPGGRPARPPAAILTYGGYVLLQLLQLAVLNRLAPRFFWFDDSQAQFGPMMWWLGRNSEGGRPPLMDPEQGMAGNLTADMQYGVLDPLHWVLQAAAARTDDLLVMAWGYAALCVLGLGLGVLVLLRHHGVPPVLAVAGALGTASSGFFLWYGSSWWPLMWSVAWLPWFWWGLSARRWWSVLVLALATWALLASGNPYVLFFALALVLAQAVEQVRAAGTVRVLVGLRTGARLAAMFGGLAMALPTLLTTVQSSPYISRQEPDPVIGNVGFGVANLADVLLGGPTLMGQTNAWGGSLQLVPAMYTFLVAVPALALVDWRRAVRAPGVLTAGSVYLLAVVFTQLPTTVSVFRYPIRYLVVVELMLPLLVLLALTAAAQVTRRRVQVAFALVLAQGLLAWFRAPVFGKWHLLATVVVAVAVAGLVLALRAPRRTLAVLGAATVLVLGAGTVFIGERMMVSLQDRVDALAGVPSPEDDPFRSLPPGRRLGTTEAEYRQRSVEPDGSATVLTYDFGPDMGWSDGVLRGNGNLIAGFAPGAGSLAVWHADLNEHWCRTYEGATCGDPEALLARAPGTGLAWVDLLSEDTVLLDDDAPTVLQEHFEQTWTAGAATGGYTEYRRDDGLPGRVTVARGVTVQQAPGGSQPARAGEPMDTYTVTTGDEAGQLAFRIPWWPGLRATLDGGPVEVGSVDGAVLALDLPAGLQDAELQLFFEPVGQRLLVPASAVGGLLTLAALGLWWGSRRRTGEPAAGVPATREDGTR